MSLVVGTRHGTEQKDQHDRFTMETRTRESQLRLKHLVEEVINEEFNLQAAGLRLAVDEAKAVGHPPERIRVWATLHFLPGGSPFCCLEPQCHLGLYGERAARISDLIRRRLKLRQSVVVEFVEIASSAHEGVRSDNARR